MFSLEFTDGTKEDVEVLREDLRELLDATLTICAHLGRKAPEGRHIADTAPAQALLLPTEDIDVRTTESGAVWLLIRVGCQDLSVALPDPTAAEILGHKLLEARR